MQPEAEGTNVGSCWPRKDFPASESGGMIGFRGSPQPGHGPALRWSALHRMEMQSHGRQIGELRFGTSGEDS